MKILEKYIILNYFVSILNNLSLKKKNNFFFLFFSFFFFCENNGVFYLKFNFPFVYDFLNIKIRNFFFYFKNKNILLKYNFFFFFFLNINNSSHLNNLFDIKNIILICSGKGGVGKSTVSSKVVYYLKEKGYKIGFLDADIYSPSISLIMEKKINNNIFISIKKNKSYLPTFSKYIKINTIGCLMNSKAPINLRGPLISSIIYNLYNKTNWGKLDFLIIDMPPGTGDIYLTILQKIPISGSLIVSTSQNLSINEILRTNNLLDELKIKKIGIIENMSFNMCLNCGFKNNLFFSGGVKNIAKKINIDYLFKLPLLKSITKEIDTRKCFSISNKIYDMKFIHFIDVFLLKIIKLNFNFFIFKKRKIFI